MLVSSNTNTVSASRCASKSIVLAALYNGFRWAGRLLNVIHLLTPSRCCGNIETPRNMLWYHSVSTTRPFLLFSHASDDALIATKPVEIAEFRRWDFRVTPRVNCISAMSQQASGQWLLWLCGTNRAPHFAPLTVRIFDARSIKRNRVLVTQPIGNSQRQRPQAPGLHQRCARIEYCQNHG